MKYLIILLINIACVAGLYAQNNASKPLSGKLVMHLRDFCGENVEKAVIQVKGNKIKRKFKSDKEGKLDAFLPVGDYTILVEKYGFKRHLVNDVQITTDAENVINLDMQIGYASNDPNIPSIIKCPPAEISNPVN